MSGYFAVGVLNPKTEANIGTLWRSAHLYGAAMIATVGRRRYERQSSDTTATPNSTPLMKFTDVDDLLTHLPYGCELIGVELDPRAKPLHNFTHPRRGFYLLGAEDHGIPLSVLDKCHRVVQIPTVKPYSMNVAAAGTVLLADRHMKSLADRGAVVS